MFTCCHVLGQMRVQLLENLYSVELRHREEPADPSHNTTARRSHATSDWLCATLGSEHLCVNVSCRFEDSDAGRVQTRLSHSFHLLNNTGIYLSGWENLTVSTSAWFAFSVPLSARRRCSFQQRC